MASQRLLLERIVSTLTSEIPQNVTSSLYFVESNYNARFIDTNLCALSRTRSEDDHRV